MKKVVWSLVGIALLASFVWLGVFYWRNLRGAYVAVQEPVEDVVAYVRENKGAFMVPKGYVMQVFAKGLGAPRVLASDPNGVLLTSIPASGRVVALPDANNDGVADQAVVVQDGLRKPHGIAFRCPNKEQCEIFIAETNQLAVYHYDSATMKASEKKKLLDLPTDGYNQHFTRTLLLTKVDGQDTLLISVGSSCNVCREQDDRRAKILFYNLATGESGEYARGLRNSVFMVHRPGTDQIWATEMGRDLLGDNTPPEEINIIEKGKNYGWPNCYGNNIHDTEFDKNTYIRNPCMEPFETPPHIEMQAHSAPLGLAFVPNKGWPQEIRGDLLVAFHGSWNRTEPAGYKIVRVKLDDKGNYEGIEDFVSGWLTKDKKVGRPVAMLMREQGGMFISDDGAGIIYWLKPK